MIQQFITNLEIALEAIGQNKLRSLLTALGIIFGVAAVITMLSIGNGAKQEILDQLELIGTNNIVIEATKPSVEDNNDSEEEESSSNASENKKSFTPGLHLNDIKTIAQIVPGVSKMSYEVEKSAKVIYGKISTSATSRGVNNDFFAINNLELAEGSFFNDMQTTNGTNVCVIGSDIAQVLFLGKSPLGSFVKMNGVGLKVIGVIKKRVISEEQQERLSVSPFAKDIFLPIQTFFLRYEDRSYVSAEDVSRNERDKKISNYHQLDKIIVKVADINKIELSASLIERVLKRKHNDQVDFSVAVPELLVKQQQSTQETLNIVLAIIAGISLLVGGIGIMNIMLSSVMERIKEIGVRRSLGAKKKDIILQFLLEAVLISLVGGMIGVILGVSGAQIIGHYADINAIVSGTSVLVSFGISFIVGLVFGILPAQKAADLDPITAIRN